MSEYGPEQISAIRKKAAEIEFRAKSDAMYFERLRRDPDEVLLEAGFDEFTRNEFKAQLGASPGPCPVDVCDPLSCIITSCCWFTTVEPPEPIAALGDGD
jgi:hypothetical protein